MTARPPPPDAEWRFDPARADKRRGYQEKQRCDESLPIEIEHGSRRHLDRGPLEVPHERKRQRPA
jgi:hypothetical protein